MSSSPISAAQGQATTLSYCLETTRGVTPGSPTLKTLRSISRAINPKKNTFESQEIRASRQVAYMRHGMESVEGSPGGELSTQSYDDWLASCFGGAWAAVNIAGSPTLGATSGSSTFSRATGSFVTDGLRPGDIIVTTGFSNTGNNGTFVVTVVATGTITVDGSLTTETTGAGKTLQVKGKRLDAGAASLDTYTIQRAFPDVSLYDVNTGVSINTVDIKVTPEQIVSIAFGLLGMKPLARSASALAVPTAPPATDLLTAFEGAIYIGGVSSAIITGVSFRFENGNSLTGVVGSKTSPDVFQGTFKGTGSFSAFVTAITNFNAFLNETPTSLYLRMNDPAGNFLSVVANNIKYTGNTSDPPRQGAVIEELPFQALEDANGVSVSIQRSNP